MIKHTKNPFLHIEFNGDERLIAGQGNTWQYFLLFAFIVKEAKEGGFANGFDDEGEEKEFIRILNKVYKCPDDAIEAFGPLVDANALSDILEALDRLFERDYVMENKKDILESLFETLTRTRKWKDEIAEMLYHKDKNGNEEVTVRLYEGNQEAFIDVTGDSGMALIKDVIAALEEMR